MALTPLYAGSATSQKSQMDSFTILNTIDTPTNEETGGSRGSTSYCVVAQRPEVVEVPADFENRAKGAVSYCTVA
ncbi:hypothetical protein FA15DRAFT_707743 [Coprinopsis marcescibilis]|uniref:Uncharacterized protein n=1 Tax=Coprinopsis marcescibilis TaxID=230819 RepID=A0A5C3KKG5_COPMA|nr:hypothetical protein FA15DRAFT_707743 [Coprinopsis marcescibilis]